LTKEGEGVGSTLLNVLKHPITIGTLGGAAIGGGIGYLSPEDNSLRRRSAMVGAGTGGALGALGGALASGSSTAQGGVPMSEAADRIRQAAVLGHERGIREGQAQLWSDLPTGQPIVLSDEMKSQLVAKALQR
jgi:hypothetical protein